MQNKEKLYVAYGSNINITQMKNRCPDAQIMDIGAIQDMQLCFNKVATLHESKLEETQCVVWKISQNDERNLDAYEGFPHKYYKEQVIVNMNGQKINAMAYIMRDKFNQHSPALEYYNKIVDGYSRFNLDITPLEDADRRAKEFENQNQNFIVGQITEQHGISLDKTEIQELVTLLNKDFKESSFRNFKDYAEDIISSISEDYEQLANEQTRYYVAYGSNMNLEQMAKRCPNSKVVGTGEILDYKLQFCQFADITQDTGATTPCVVWEINNRDWSKLDFYEGYPNLYRKDSVDIETNGKTEKATAYIMQPEYAKSCLPSKSYLDGIIEGYRQNNISNTTPISKALEQTVLFENSPTTTKGVAR